MTTAAAAGASAAAPPLDSPAGLSPSAGASRTPAGAPGTINRTRPSVPEPHPSIQSAAAATTATAGAGAPHPPFLASTLHLLGSYGTSPLRLDAGDLLWLAPSVAVSWITLHNDVPLYRAMATGDARKTWLDHSMPMVSALGDGLTEAGFAALAAELGPDRLARTSVVAIQALAIAGVYGEGLKIVAWSNRPYENDNGHYFWDFGQSTQGMPSGHSFSAFAAAEVYGAEYGREWTYPVAALVAYSRVYNQDHWPSDVVVGSILGIIAGVQARQADALFGTPNLRFRVADDALGTPEVVADARF